MRDTTPAMERKFHRMLMERSGVERLKMGCSMDETARALAKSSISKQHPKASPAELKRLLFLHFCASDFEAEGRKRIASALSERAKRAGVEEVGKRGTLNKRPAPEQLDTTTSSSRAGAVREKGESYGRAGKAKAKRGRLLSG